jgi:putative cell wall-binding protein
MRGRTVATSLMSAVLLVALFIGSGTAFARPSGGAVTVSAADVRVVAGAAPLGVPARGFATALRSSPGALAHSAAPLRTSAFETQIDVSNVAIDFIGDEAWVMGTVTNRTGSDKQTVRVYVDGRNGSTAVASWFDFVPAHVVQASGDSAPFMVYLGNAGEVMALGITDWDIAAFGNDDRYPYLTFPGVGAGATWSPVSPPWDGHKLSVFAVPHNSSTTATATFPSSSWEVTATLYGTSFLLETFGGFDYGARIAPSTSATLTATMHWNFPSGTTDWAKDGHIDARTPSDVRRVWGATCYDTAAALSRDAYASATHVIVATGQKFPDALSSAALAGMVHGPVLLTTPATLSSATRTEIVRLGAKSVYIVGGEGVVSRTVRDQLAAIPGVTSVKRVSGHDLYDTSREVALEVKRLGGDYTHPFLARGDDFADAMGLGPLAYASHRPILLTKRTSVPAGTASAVTALGVVGGMVAGGPAAVSTSVADQVYGAGNWYRAYGADCYATAVRVAETGVAQGWVLPNRVCVACGTGFPDGLAAGAAVGAQNGLILLTKPTLANEGGLEEMSWFAPFITYGRVAGGTGAVSASCYDDWAATMRGE